ncbi:unnamed protein product [Notodromas monacha]|uniref:Acyl-CoA-binding domain-containing protein 6 n=1 Tax=Notodromas monacha TaxID=399045 RepID=A0A7R9BVK2_9CRUS|nr:unnamed protein product [Notodromas monacha]CAG0921476.1 unnamed protein product [Notodromas monacha]
MNEEESADINADFNLASQYVRTLSSLSVEKMLEFYGLFKQAKEGPCKIPKPGLFDFEGKKKWQAWKNVGDLSQDDAKARYIDVLDNLEPEWRGKMETGNVAKKPAGFGVSVSSMYAKEKEKDSSSDTSSTLHDFIVSGSVDKAKDLLNSPDAAMLVAARDPDSGLTPLQMAADRGQAVIVAAILRVPGVDVNVADAEGQTALHYASSCGHGEVVDLLLAAGADTGVKDNDGLGPVDVAFDDDVARRLKRSSSSSLSSLGYADEFADRRSHTHTNW